MGYKTLTATFKRMVGRCSISIEKLMIILGEKIEHRMSWCQ